MDYAVTYRAPHDQPERPELTEATFDALIGNPAVALAVTPAHPTPEDVLLADWEAFPWPQDASQAAVERDFRARWAALAGAVAVMARAA